ncbi:hypothetical protein ACMD2_25411 [Ananas comosus]|uniref:RING-CH-type domain-containing protein n=1 Tax=Ananas comosus TaxID=4615 RepID=A0A199V2C2_ANACO|nr:hypothetical protein ACMD2_25411 [Ananas comosus]
MADPRSSSPLTAPAAAAEPGDDEIDLESGAGEQFQCRICLETDGRDFIAPCKCKGTSKYVHRECLDHWRSVKEGFAFSHCTTCKAPYYLRVQIHTDRKWRTLKFRFFVTRDMLFIFIVVQLVISSLAYLVYVIDGYQQYWLRLAWGFDSEVSFYYICECGMIWLSLVENYVSVAATQDCHLPGTLCMWTDCTACFEGCAGTAGECGGCLSGAGEAGLPLLLIIGIIVLGLFTVIGIFYSVLVATMEYVVEDVDGEGTNWCPPPLPPEHVHQLRALGLL